MLQLAPNVGDRPLRVLCLGAHSDDIEIGCAGTLTRWSEECPSLEILWVVLSATDLRGLEARRSAQTLLGARAAVEIVLGDFADSRLPGEMDRAKSFLLELRQRMQPDIVFTHRLEDRHQDHRLLGELTWQVWRDQLVLEYEVPKYEGDLGQPNVYVPLSADQRKHKTNHLCEHFGSQRSKDWFTSETFDALMRLRGIECRAPAGYAEAFHARKIVL